MCSHVSQKCMLAHFSLWCHDIVAQAQCNDFVFSLIISRHYNLFNGRGTEIQNVNACNILT